jgi:hypothetical protein
MDVKTLNEFIAGLDELIEDATQLRDQLKQRVARKRNARKFSPEVVDVRDISERISIHAQNMHAALKEQQHGKN